jgi:hypothetical protein
MKNRIQIITLLSTLSLAGSVHAGVTVFNNTLGSATSFPTFSLSGSGTTLSFQDVIGTTGGTSLPGPGNAAQGAVANNAFGEVFNWSGGSATLNALSLIDTGGGGTASYQPFLFDLGTGIFNSTATTFNPSAQTDLLSPSLTVTPPALGSANFVEFDFSGADAITLTSGHSYAFGLLNNNNNASFNLLRSGGGSSDPNGIGFTLTSLGASTESSGFSGNPRTAFIGLYTTVAAVPEPGTMAMMSMGIVGIGALLRRKQ